MASADVKTERRDHDIDQFGLEVNITIKRSGILYIYFSGRKSDKKRI